MPANKPRARAQPPPQPSDYETDAPQVDVPRPPRRSNEQLNLSALQRHYPDITSLLHVASYTVLYVFSLTTNTWEKTGIEGTLFVCQLTPSPIGADRFSVVILNRRALENFDMEITTESDIEITAEYIILQGDQIYGLWVFSEPTPSSTAGARDETVEKILALARQADESRRALEQVAVNGSSAAQQADGGVAMGRQLSLRELFGQQREQDAAWSVHNHHTLAPVPAGQVSGMSSGFAPTPSPGQLGRTDGSGDHLGQLLAKMKQGYNGVG